MSLPVCESTQRKRMARYYLVLIFVVMRFSDYLLYRFLSLPENGSPALIGALVGSVVGSTALIVGVWRRQSWARYLLIGLNWAFIAVVSYPVFVAWGRRELAFTLQFQLIVAALLLYGGATGLLVCSKRIRHLAAMSMIGR